VNLESRAAMTAADWLATWGNLGQLNKIQA
jgi:hypothetical protein